jgi:hypothetical protein
VRISKPEVKLGFLKLFFLISITSAEVSRAEAKRRYVAFFGAGKRQNRWFLAPDANAMLALSA